MPGSGLRNVTKLATKEIDSFTKEDLVIIWGGANDVNKNESIKGLKNLHEFVEQRINTNFMIVMVPHRHDLLDTSCVNNEVQNFNAKLHKLMKNIINVRILELSTTRDDFTKHGLHLNATGKDKIAKLMFQKILGWNFSLLDTSTGNNIDRNEEYVDDNNEGSTDSPIPSTIQDMDAPNIVNDIPQAAEEEQITIINKKVRSEELTDPNTQETANSADSEQMIINIDKGRSEDVIDLNTQEILEDKQMTITINKVPSEDQIDLSTQAITKNEQDIDNKVSGDEQIDLSTQEITRNEQDINNKVSGDEQIDRNTKGIRISTRPKKFPNTRSDDFLWV